MVTPIHLPQGKLPLIRSLQKSPRRIPKEYLFSKNQFSKTPSPFHVKVKYFVSKEFIQKAVQKVQHVTLVENLTGRYCGSRKQNFDMRCKKYSASEEIEKGGGNIIREKGKNELGCIGIQRFSYFI
jgi:hypothetical protein